VTDHLASEATENVADFPDGVPQLSWYSQWRGPPTVADPDVFEGQDANVSGVQPEDPGGQAKNRRTETGPEEDQWTVKVPSELFAAGTSTDAVLPPGVNCPSSWLVDCCVTADGGVRRRAARAPAPTTTNATPTITNHGRIGAQGGELPKNHSLRVGTGDSRLQKVPRCSNTRVGVHDTL
jgi:hypothetical protein